MTSFSLDTWIYLPLIGLNFSLTKAFALIDADQDGSITFEELVKIIEKAGVNILEFRKEKLDMTNFFY